MARRRPGAAQAASFSGLPTQAAKAIISPYIARRNPALSPRITSLMRRRIRSAAFPLHRHSLPQLATDGVLVALAYYLAYQLRFDQGVPDRYQDLFTATSLWAVAASVCVFTLFRLYQKWWRYVSGRDYVSIVQAIVVATLSVPAFNALTHPVTARSDEGLAPVNVPPGVLVLFFLLTLTFVAGARFAARLLHDPRARGFRPHK